MVRTFNSREEKKEKYSIEISSARIHLPFVTLYLSQFHNFITRFGRCTRSVRTFVTRHILHTDTRSHRSPQTFEHEFDRPTETSHYTPSDRLQFTSERTQRDGFQAGRGIPRRIPGTQCPTITSVTASRKPFELTRGSAKNFRNNSAAVLAAIDHNPPRFRAPLISLQIDRNAGYLTKTVDINLNYESRSALSRKGRRRG